MEALPVGVAITDIQGRQYQVQPRLRRGLGRAARRQIPSEDYAAYKAWWADTGEPVRPEEWASARAVQKGEPVGGRC